MYIFLKNTNFNILNIVYLIKDSFVWNATAFRRTAAAKLAEPC